MEAAENYRRLREEIPEYVTIVVAAKTRTAEEVSAVVDAGATDVGENYVQEGMEVKGALGDSAGRARWHLIGPLQKNKVNKALATFDVIQTVGDYEIAEAIDKRVERAGRDVVPVYLEINIGSEATKYGLRPDYGLIEDLVRRISGNLTHLRIEGLMTMGPRSGDPEDLRPYFRRTREIFERLRDLDLPGVDMRVLSMGMTGSYRVAIEEGSNMVRIGTAIFGARA